MNPVLLILLSAMVLAVIFASLKVAFRCIEKAHEHLRESERSRGSAELVRERVG